MSVLPAPAMAQKHDRRDRHEDRRDRSEDRRDRRDDDRGYRYRPAPYAWRSYDERHFEPGQRGYDPARYYRSGRPVSTLSSGQERSHLPRLRQPLLLPS